jgi:short-subunit dehydrogenase
MGRALARAMAERGAQMVLLGRDLEDLRRSADDLRTHGAALVAIEKCDLLEPQSFQTAFDQAASAMNGLDTVVVTAGLFANQDALETDSDLTQRLLTADFTNTILFCEEARKRLLAAGGGTLCVFSSVAGERGRKPVILYGAAKAGLSYYLEGLDHKFRAQGLRTIAVKPGFVKTGMTAGLKPPPFAGEPDQVAKIVMQAIERGTPEVYAPGPWRFVMLVIRNLPRAVMRRIGF